MASIQNQIVFCTPYQSCDPIVIEPPFGLPPFTFNDPCCKGIDTLLVDLSQMLAPLIPFLTLVDCIVKLVEITMAIPDCIGPPPDLEKLANLANMIADFIPCVGKIIGLAPLPINIVAFAKFIRGLMQLFIAILSCLKKVFTVFIDINADVLALSLTTDDYLKKMGICLASQSATMRGALTNLINSLLNVFNLLNLFIGLILSAIPPLKKFLEDEGFYPITPQIDLNSGLPVDLSWIDDIIAVLSAIEAVANVIAGGS